MTDATLVSQIKAGLDPGDFVQGTQTMASAAQKAADQIVQGDNQVVASKERVRRSVVDGGGAFDRLRQQVDESYRSTQRYAQAQDITNRAVLSGRASQDEANRVLAKYREQLDNSGKTLQKHGEMSGQAAFAQRMLATEVFKVGTELTYSTSPALVLGGAIHHIGDVALSTGEGISGLGSIVGGWFSKLSSLVVANPIATAIIAIGAAIAYVSVTSEMAAHKLEGMSNSLVGVRNDYESLAPVIRDAAKELAGQSDLNRTQAQTMLMDIYQSPSFGGSPQQAIDIAKQFSELNLTLGKSADDATLLKQALEDPAKAIEELSKTKLAMFNQGLANQAQLLEEAGKKGDAFNLLLHQVHIAAEQVVSNQTDLQKAWRALDEAYNHLTGSSKGLTESLGMGLNSAFASVIGWVAKLIEWLAKLTSWSGPSASTAPGGGGRFGGSGNPTLDLHNNAVQGDTANLIYRLAQERAGFSDADAPIADLALRVAYQESRGRQFNADGSVYKGPVIAGRPAWDNQAVGMMQLMPSTARGIGVDPNNLEENVTGGLKEILRLSKVFSNLADIAAAYNMGEQGYKDVIAGKRTIPAETKDYIAKVTPGIQPSYLSAANQPTAVSGTATASGVLNNNTAEAANNAEKLYKSTVAFQRESLQAKIAELDEMNKKLSVGSQAWEHNQADITKLRVELSGLRDPMTETERMARSAEQTAAAFGAQAGAARTLVEITQKYKQIANETHTPLDDANMARDLAAAQAKLTGEFEDSVRAINQQADAQDKQIVALEKGGIAAEHAANHQKALIEAIKTSVPGTAEYARQVEVLTNALNRQSDVKYNAQAAQEVKTLTDQQTLLKAQISTLGESYGARQRDLAEIQLRIKWGVDLNAQLTSEQQKAVDTARANADLAESLKLQEASANEWANSMSSSFDNIGNAMVNAFMSGKQGAVNFQNTMKSVAEQIIQEFLKLSIINPLLNSMFPNTQLRPTLDSVMSATGGSGTAFGGGLLGWLGLGGASAADTALASSSVASGVASGAISTISRDALLAVAHEGWLVGSAPSATRSLSMPFVDVPRFHSGLLNDEFAAVLQRGERVLTERQNGRLGHVINSLADITSGDWAAAGGHPPVIMNISTPDANSFKQNQNQIMQKAGSAMQTARVRGGTYR